MSGKGSSSWPTANAGPQNDTDANWKERRQIAKEKHGNNGFGLTLGMAATDWQTTRVSIGPYTRDKGQKGAERLTLEGQSQQWEGPGPKDLWFTPDVPNGGRALAPEVSLTGMTPDGKKRQVGLANQAVRVMETWPTQASRDWKGENSTDHLENGTGRLHLDQLPNFVAHCFTPPAQRTWISGVSPSIWRPISRRLFRSAMSSVSPTVQRRWLRKGSWRKKRLNPWFVEWLMAWPPGHGLCACSAMEFALWQRQMRGALSRMPMASGAWIWRPPVETADPIQMAMEW